MFVILEQKDAKQLGSIRQNRHTYILYVSGEPPRQQVVNSRKPRIVMIVEADIKCHKGQSYFLNHFSTQWGGCCVKGRYSIYCEQLPTTFIDLWHPSVILYTLVRRKLGMVVAQKNSEFLIFRRRPVTENWEIPNF